MALADVGLGVLLFVLFARVDRTLSLMAMAFRLAQAAVLGLNLLNLQRAASLAHSSLLPADVRDGMVQDALASHAAGYDLGLFFFAINCLLVGVLVARSGLGTDTTSALLVAAGDNPNRLRNEASFAHLCGVAPIDASSGKHERHRLNRGGDRQANSALWTIAICRMAADQTTRDYINRRISEGLTKKEAIRCLKRHISREVYHHLPRPQPAP